MRRVKVDNIYTLSASSEQSSFEATYLSDDFPGRIWKTGDSKKVGTITIDIVKGVSDIFVFNTNAHTVSLLATGGSRAYWADSTTWADSTAWAQSSLDGSALSPTTLFGGNNVHLQLASQLGPCTIQILLTANEQLYAGKVVAGFAENYGGVGTRYGFSATFVDRSLQIDHPRYYTKRATPKSWGVSLLMTHDEAVQFIDDFDTYGSENHAWKIATGDYAPLICYGYAHSPGIAFSYPHHSGVTFTLQEVK